MSITIGQRPRTHHKNVEQIHQAMVALHVREARERHQERHNMKQEVQRLRGELEDARRTISELKARKGVTGCTTRRK